MSKEKFGREEYSVRDLITLKLLDNPAFWRLRAIERIVISKAMWSERDREIHVRSLTEAAVAEEAPRVWNLQRDLDLLRLEAPDDVKGNGKVKLTLPIAEMPKVPLLDLHIDVAEKQVYRLRMDDSARIQARYVRYLSADIDEANPIAEDLEDFLAALFYFPTQAYDDIWRANGTRLRGDKYKVKEYLRGMPLLKDLMDGRIYDNWSSICETSERIVKGLAFEEHLSGTQNPLITLPHFIHELTVRGAMSNEMERDPEKLITPLLGRLRDFLLNVEEKAKETGTPAGRAAEKVLDTYASCGHRWMMFAKCIVPLDDPFAIKVKEERAIYFARRGCERFKIARRIPFGEYCGKTAWKMVSFSDAETNHVSIRLADTSVRMLRKCEVLSANGGPAGDKIDEERKTFELYLRHSSLGRPERIWIKCHLRLSRVMSCFLYLAMFITAFAVFLLVFRGAMEIPRSTEGLGPVTTEKDYTHGLTAKDATLILVPAAFVASFLLVKDSSTLAMRVRRLRQAILVFEFFVMLAVAFTLFAVGRIWSSP